MVYTKKGRLVAVLYESISEPGSRKKFKFAENAERHARQLTGEGHDPAYWLGAPSHEVLQGRMTTGWPEGVKRLSELATAEVAVPTNVRRRRVRGEQGDEVDMQRVWAGNLSTAWSRTRRQSRCAQRSVSIVCNLSCNADVSSDAMFWRGAAALRLLEALSAAGYNVGLYAAAAARSCTADGTIDNCRVCEVKAPDMPLDMSALAAIVAMIGFKRTALHAAAVEIADEEGKPGNPSLGAADDTLLAPGIAQLPIPSNAFIQGRINNKADAERWIAECLSRIEQPELEAA